VDRENIPFMRRNPAWAGAGKASSSFRIDDSTNLHERSTMENSRMSIAAKKIALAFVSSIVLSMPFEACAASPESDVTVLSDKLLETVKRSYIEEYPKEDNYPAIGKAFEKFFERPKWEVAKGNRPDIGPFITVHFSGIAQSNGNKVRVAIFMTNTCMTVAMIQSAVDSVQEKNHPLRQRPLEQCSEKALKGALKGEINDELWIKLLNSMQRIIEFGLSIGSFSCAINDKKVEDCSNIFNAAFL
jgi:hypothetical protein